MSSTDNLPLTLACWDYDRTRPLMEDRVRFDGINLTYLNLVIEEIFFRQMRHREFDASELSFSSFLVSMFEDDPSLAGISKHGILASIHSCGKLQRLALGRGYQLSTTG